MQSKFRIPGRLSSSKIRLKNYNWLLQCLCVQKEMSAEELGAAAEILRGIL